MSPMDKIFDEKIYVNVGKRYGERMNGFVRLSADGRSVAAYVRHGQLGKKTIVYFHGNGEDLVDCGLGHTDRFERLGYTVAAVDYPGYGLSDGPFGEVGCYENAHALYDHLVKVCLIRPEDIIVIGCSLGSGVALELASSVLIGGLVLEVAFYSGAREAVDMAELFGLRAMKSLLAGIKKFPSAERIKRVTCPVLSIHGTEDEIVPFAQGRELYANAPNGYGFIEVPSANHCGFIRGLGERQYEQLIVRFVESID